AEAKDSFVEVTSDSGGLIYLDLKETGENTQIFRNSEAEGGELLYLSTINSDGEDKDQIKVVNEQVLTFSIQIQPGTYNYVTCKTVMVDRAEVVTEWQHAYSTECECDPPASEINTLWFASPLNDNIGGEPGLVWHKCKLGNYASRREHWYKGSDTMYADANDFASWSGHNGWLFPGWHFFRQGQDCIGLVPPDIKLGDTDNDWVVFDTCASLNASQAQLETALLNSERCPHLFCGFVNTAYWDFEDAGEYFAQRLKQESIKKAWFNYCKYKQPVGTTVRVFGADYCMDESLLGSGPIEVERDPTSSSTWTYDDFTRTE
ncbi:MAG: hypothetical protein JSW00_14250, partial [Thermoplasmata archaeon]